MKDILKAISCSWVKDDKSHSNFAEETKLTIAQRVQEMIQGWETIIYLKTTVSFKVSGILKLQLTVYDSKYSSLHWWRTLVRFYKNEKHFLTWWRILWNQSFKQKK